MSEELLKGGEADNIPDSEFDPEQLEKGIKYELKEHVKDEENAVEKAKEIAKDHLMEIGNYYDYLEEMEEKAKAEKDSLPVSLESLSIKWHNVNPVAIKSLIQRVSKSIGLEGDDTAYEMDLENEEMRERLGLMTAEEYVAHEEQERQARDKQSRCENMSEREIEIEESFEQFDIAFENYCRVGEILEEMKTTTTVSKPQMVSLENHFPGSLPENCLIEGFTVYESKTNYDVAMEAVTLTEDHAKGALALIGAGLLARVLFWVYQKVKGIGGQSKASLDSAKAASDTAKESNDILKEFKSLGSEIPVEREDKKPISSSDFNTTYNEKELSPLSKEVMAGMSGEQLTKLLIRRQATRLENTFNGKYNKMMEAMLNKPSDWLALLITINQTMGKLTSNLEKQHDEMLFAIKKSRGQKADRGEGDIHSVSDTFDAAGLTDSEDASGTGQFKARRFSIDKISPNLISKLDSLLGSKYSGDNELEHILIIKDALTSDETSFSSIIDSSKIELNDIYKFVDVVESKHLDTEDFTDRLQSIYSKLGGEDKPISGEVTGQRQYNIIAKAAAVQREEIRKAQTLAAIYTFILRNVGLILKLSISVNGNNSKDVQRVLNSSKSLIKDKGSKKLKDYADKYEEKLNNLSNLVGKWTSDVSDNKKEISEAKAPEIAQK